MEEAIRNYRAELAERRAGTRELPDTVVGIGIAGNRSDAREGAEDAWRDRLRLDFGAGPYREHLKCPRLSETYIMEQNLTLYPDYGNVGGLYISVIVRECG